MIFVSKSKSAEKFNTAGSGAFLYLAASCKFLSLAASPAKRFRPCKLRVCSVSTSNQKTTKKISLKVSSNLRESRAVSLSTGNAEERATELDFPDIDNSDLKQGLFYDGDAQPEVEKSLDPTFHCISPVPANF